MRDSLTFSKEIVRKMKDKEKKKALMARIQEAENSLRGGVGLPTSM